MKKIVLLSLLFVLCLTACNEKEPDNNNSTENEEGIGENNDNSVQTEGDKDVGPDEKSGEDNNEIVYLSPWATVESSSVYVENGELKEIEFQTFSGEATYNGKTVKVAFDWIFHGDVFDYRMVEPHNSWFEVMPGCTDKILWIYAADGSNDINIYYVADLKTGSIELAVSSEVVRSEDLSGILVLPEKEGTIFTTKKGEIYHYDESGLTNIGDLLGTDGEHIYEPSLHMVNSQVLLVYTDNLRSMNGILTSYKYDYQSKSVEKVLQTEFTGNTLEKEVRILGNEPYGICKRDGYLTIVNLYDGRHNVTTVSENTAKRILSVSDEYLLVLTTENKLIIIEKANGRIVAQTDSLIEYLRFSSLCTYSSIL